jgi:lysozyme family protein
MTDDDIIDLVLKFEGGFSDNKDDQGNWYTTSTGERRLAGTNFGITCAEIAKYLGKDVTETDVRNFPKASAREIYAKAYIAKPGFETLPDVIKAQVVDTGVNCGPGRAVTLMQTALNTLGYKVAVDGGLGPKTRAACDQACAQQPTKFVNALVDARVAYYDSIDSPKNHQFEAGWHARAEAFRVKEPASEPKVSV